MLVDSGSMLGGDDDVTEPDGSIIVVFYCCLGFTVRPKPTYYALPADPSQAAGQTMRQSDGERHELWSVVACVTKHQPLVTCTLESQYVILRSFTSPDLVGCIHTLRDICRLGIDRHVHTARGAVEAFRRGVVTDVYNLLTDNGRYVNVGLRSDLSGDMHLARCDQSLNRDSTGRVPGQ